MKAHKNKSFFLINALIIFGFISFQILNIENPHISLGKYNASFFYTGGSPAGKTGAPGEGNCTQCHAGMVNSGLSTSTLTSSGNNEYVPGNTYNLTLDIQNGSAKNGFQIVVLDSISNSNAGNFIVTDANNTKLISGNNRFYITHKATGTSLTNWSFDWTAPPTNVGPITFYYAYNVTNNAYNSSGDQIYLSDFTIYPNSCGSFANTTQVTNTSCYGYNDGIISISSSGGNTPYTYSWSNGLNGSYQNSLSAGTYNVIATDANGCSESLSLVVNEPPPLLNTNTVNNVTCNGGIDGAIYPNVTGGTPPYTYIWSNGVPFVDNVGIPASIYFLNVYDANGCMDSSDIQVTEPPLISSTETITNCGPYTWIDGQTYFSTTSLPSYTLNASNGCDSVVYLDLTVNNIDLSVTDNSPTLSANQVNATYQWLDCDNSFTAVVGQTNPDFTATVNGNYSVEISYNNCIDTTACYLVSNVALCQQCNDDIQIYPNPVHDELNITQLNPNEKVEIFIYDLYGRMVLNPKTTQRLNLSYLKPGRYVVKLSSSRFSKSFSISKI